MNKESAPNGGRIGSIRVGFEAVEVFGWVRTQVPQIAIHRCFAVCESSDRRGSKSVQSFEEHPSEQSDSKDGIQGVDSIVVPCQC